MSTIIDPPEEGQVPAPAPAPVPAFWSDPETICTVVFRLRTLISDVQGAAEDQLQPRRERRLGHLEAERILRESFDCLDELLSLAERNLPTPPPTLPPTPPIDD
jgi:hypothetical protein